MSLSQYKKKRHFNDTPEPAGKTKSSKRELVFVVQKHDASHVHYDFRLELKGVLISWAVPKGPSLNPADKRLAMMVEDHPYDYRNFEGIIPAGNYGGGTVIVWDEGTYFPAGGEGLTIKEQEKMLSAQLHAGNMKLVLKGKKLKGEFHIFLMKGRGERSWILSKKKDEYSSEANVTDDETSVKTGKTLVEVASENGTVVNHPEAHGTKPKKSAGKRLAKKPETKMKTAAIKQAHKKKAPALNSLLGSEIKQQKVRMPKDVAPMLATLVDEAFDNDEWIYEIKWDGYRAVSYVNKKQVNIVSRNNISFTEKYIPVTEALKELDIDAVLDGEIVAIGEDGLANFQLMQNWTNNPAKLQYYVFDIIWINGYDLTKVPLIERKNILRKLIPENNEVIKYSDHIIGKGKDFFKVATSKGLEGIMAKKASSLYESTRSNSWLKIKVNLRQEVVIAGFTQPKNQRQFFGALLLGVYEKKELIYVGHTGGGFNTKSLETIYKKLQPLIIKECPFSKVPVTNMPATWVKPKLVCEIKFTEWTKSNVARHPIFMGLRTDKNPKDVSIEMAKKIVSKPGEKKVVTDATKEPAKKKAASKKKTGARSSTRETAQQVEIAGDKEKTITIDSHDLKLTNLSKIYWKKEGFKKGDMINYYLKIAPFMMPYMNNRPQSLNRHPNGIDGPNFYQKDVKGKVPDWIETHKDFSESTNETVEYLVCNNEATLIYMANLGCIEMHPWHSRIQSPDNPDWCLIDLDPDNKNTFEQVIQTAQVVKKVLDSIGAESYPKTSGSTGIHIYIPLGAKYSYDQSKQLAELVVNIVHQELATTTSIERSPAKRKGKIYLDYLQNRQTQTAAAPYSLRPKPGVPVSTPLDWSEVKKGLTTTTYNAYTIFDRLKAEGDLFKKVLGKGINLEKVLDKIQSLL